MPSAAGEATTDRSKQVIAWPLLSEIGCVSPGRSAVLRLPKKCQPKGLRKCLKDAGNGQNKQ